MKYRKKPVVVEAFQYTWPGKKEPVFIHSALEEGVIDVVRIRKLGGSFIETRLPNGEVALKINTLEGPVYALQNDYIIKGVEGELYPCKPDIFHKTYELVGE